MLKPSLAPSGLEESSLKIDLVAFLLTVHHKLILVLENHLSPFQK